MSRSPLILTAALGVSLVLSFPALADCPAGMVESGSTCVDTYEASIWKFTNPMCILAAKNGHLPPAICFLPANGVEVTPANFPPNCGFLNGAGCTNVFAVSKAGVMPTGYASYFLAAAACRNSGKRLLTNAEWQAAALGTPDPWPQPAAQAADLCNVSGPAAVPTGSRVLCTSDVGAFDMVGNVIERVGDWGPLATTGTNWDVFLPGFGGDVSNLGGAPSGTIYGLPGSTIRGGSFAFGSGGNGQLAGVYAIDQNGAPNSIGDGTAAGFRCGKENR